MDEFRTLVGYYCLDHYVTISGDLLNLFWILFAHVWGCPPALLSANAGIYANMGGAAKVRREVSSIHIQKFTDTSIHVYLSLYI